MAKLYDCFMFCDELDMLELRLHELDGPFIYRHVLVESPHDNHGRPKPLHYQENRDRFAGFADRIRHVVTPVLPGPGAWDREHQQRDAGMAGLADATPDDIVLISDVDEIPSPLALAARPEPALAYQQRNVMLAVDLLHPVPQVTSVMVRMSAVGSLSSARDSRGAYPVLADAGTHLSWLGGPEAVDRKLAMHCHTRGELDAMTSVLVPVDVDKTWPKWVAERRCPGNWWRAR